MSDDDLKSQNLFSSLRQRLDSCPSYPWMQPLGCIGFKILAGFGGGRNAPFIFSGTFALGGFFIQPPSFIYTATWTNFLVSKKGSSKVLLSSQVVKGAFTVDSSSVKSPPLR